MFKNHITYFYTSHQRISQIVKLKKFDLENVGQSHGAVVPFDGKYMTSYVVATSCLYYANERNVNSLTFKMKVGVKKKTELVSFD